jgi:SagB-type dehydrogenase family enzyme
VSDAPLSSSASTLLRHELAGIVYGEAGPRLEDPAETYHEASKLSPAFAGRLTHGRDMLETSSELQGLVRNSVKRYEGRPRRALRAPVRLGLPLGEALASRRSSAPAGGARLTTRALATILAAAYGSAGWAEGSARRTSPSAGALYPLELYLFVNDVPRHPSGVFHYDPLAHRLEELARASPERLARALVHADLAQAALLLVVTALFWRSRFKYGLRGYRFALLEAGHVMQNALLACAALGVAAVPVGGFFDRRLERLLGVDGVNEAVVYCAAVGRRNKRPIA